MRHTPHEFTEELRERIAHLCEIGEELITRSRRAEALANFQEALALVPRPRENRSETTRIYKGIGECHFQALKFLDAFRAFRWVMNCPGAAVDPWIRLRRGQIYLELGYRYMASHELIAAYRLGGMEIFAREDPKYSALVLPRVKSLEDPAG